jgi:hypothetical protein
MWMVRWKLLGRPGTLEEPMPIEMLANVPKQVFDELATSSSGNKFITEDHYDANAGHGVGFYAYLPVRVLGASGRPIPPRLVALYLFRRNGVKRWDLQISPGPSATPVGHTKSVLIANTLEEAKTRLKGWIRG